MGNQNSIDNSVTIPLILEAMIDAKEPIPSPSNSSGNEEVDGNCSLSGGRGGSSSESSNQGEGMQARHQRQNNSSKHKTNNNTLINKGEKRYCMTACMGHVI